MLRAWAALALASLFANPIAASAAPNTYVFSPDRSKVPIFITPAAYCNYIQAMNDDPLGLKVAPGVRRGVVQFLAFDVPVVRRGNVVAPCGDTPVTLIRILVNGTLWFILPGNLTRHGPNPASSPAPP